MGRAGILNFGCLIMAINDPKNFDDLWKAIIHIHNESKALFILCEEIEPHEFRSFLQPFNELRHAYEHVVRSKANEFGMGKKLSGSEYQYNSLNKALGHEYRGFFDCADWLAVILREAIIETLKPFPLSCIQAALPEYYSNYRIRIDKISKEIATIRGDKDIEGTNKTADGDEDRGNTRGQASCWQR